MNAQAEEWPSNAMAPGVRVTIIKDAAWDGPWAEVFSGAIDAAIVPSPVRHKMGRTGELQYLVVFDEPQFDSTGSGPYRKAVIWERYLQAETS